MSHQIEMVSLDQLIDRNHNYRKFKESWDLKEVQKEIEKIEITPDLYSFTQSIKSPRLYE